jgi:hypothetical protein
VPSPLGSSGVTSGSLGSLNSLDILESSNSLDILESSNSLDTLDSSGLTSGSFGVFS